MKSLINNLHTKKKGKCLGYTGLFILILFCSCRSTKLVPEGKYLLNRVSFQIENKLINKEELKSYIKQKPNKKILWVVRFHLGVYNIANSGKEKKWKKKTGTIIGEEPVILDDYLTEKTIKQLTLYLKNKGYYHASVTDSILYKKKKANMTYRITTGNPYTIKTVTYAVEDPLISEIIVSDSANRLLKKGILLDVDILDAEREKIARKLKNAGYYYFLKEYVYFKIDSSLLSNEVNLSVHIKKNLRKTSTGEFVEEDHRKYKIRSIYIYTQYDPRMALQNTEEYSRSFDTTVYQDLIFLFRKKMNIKPDVIFRANHIKAGNYYCLDDIENTFNTLSSLKIYKLVNIILSEPPLPEGSMNSVSDKLDCYIQLTPYTIQSYTVELEGTNTSGNMGVAGNLLYQHKNLFNGAEIFNIKLKGALQAQTAAVTDHEKQIREYLPFNTSEIGAETGINIPKFYSPFVSEKFFRRYNPKTSITMAFNFQRRPDYTRNITNATFGYFWKKKEYGKVLFNPIEIHTVEISKIDSSFLESIRNTFRENSYKDYLISETNYSYIYNTQDIKKRRNFMYFRINLESAGNTLSTMNKLTRNTNEGGKYIVMGRKYAQYVKMDMDYRYYHVFNQDNRIVYRGFIGCGYPYGNSDVMPFVKQYFTGGANSIRAWQVRSLGPGSFSDSTQSRFPNQASDIILEANVEYRFHLFWLLNGALFMDAGNIWAINKNDDRPGALFEANRFYNEIAVGTGIGLRFDLSYFVFRFDIGMKLREPYMPVNQRWIFGNRPVSEKNFAYNLGIGYPF